MYRLFLFLLIGFSISYAQTIGGQPFTHTFSIVARDTITGDLGVAVQSHWFSVGSVVSWAEPGVGAVATQSLVNVSFGQRALDLMRSGKTAPEALKILIEADDGRDFRQLAIIDTTGKVAVYTGEKCIADAGHISGNNFSVQANMMLNKKVWPAMAAAFKHTSGPLAERMLAALEAGQHAGGDIRGQQSAAILVVRGKSTGKIWKDRLIDLRVEDNAEAVKEIGRILRLFRAYEHMNNGDLAIEHGDETAALSEYGAAEKMFPDNVEMRYWHAVSLVNIDKTDMALPIFKDIFLQDTNWVQLTRRIARNDMLHTDDETLQKILNLHK
jgi:uncharacterized Ntn-hydrolase superfamily protein